jgi:hypothetical protein
MKKYDLSKIMKRAWELKRSWNCRALTFGECLKRAWSEAKEAVKVNNLFGIKFVNGMNITVNGITCQLRRWTKAGYDRIYVNDGSRKGGGYIDIINRENHLTSNFDTQKKMAEIILSMEF